MPTASSKTSVTVRVTRQQHEAWTSAAQADDRSLSKWIMRLCDAATKPDRKSASKAR